MKSRIIMLLASCGLIACSEEIPDTRVMVLGGDPERGVEMINAYGCGTCHRIPGVRGARGLVGPPLTHWSERAYIAGALVNNPVNLVQWIMFPDSVEPGTAMPTLGVSRRDATDVAAYLFSIRDPEAAGPPRLMPVRWLHGLMPRGAKRAH